MIDLTHARWKMDAAIAAARASGQQAIVEQIDAVLCEDDRTVMFLAHLIDGEGIAVNLTLPEPIDPDTFDPTAWATALTEAGATSTLH